MFLLKEKRSYTAKVCPNGHSPSDLILSVIIDNFEYCPECGAKLVDKVNHYTVYKCSNCNNSLSLNMQYCPYCGEKKEKGGG